MRSIKRTVALVLVCFTVLLCAAGCGSKGKTLMKLDGEELSVNLFELYLSRMKGMLCTASYYGSNATQESFWDTWMDVNTWTTYNDHYTALVLESAKTYLAAEVLFEERGLKLPESYIEEIDSEMERLVAEEADGSRTVFNGIIGAFGVNYDMLREAYIVEAKIKYLRDDLFGARGEKIGANVIDDYYKDNYARFKQVFLYTFEYVYETDENGDLVYYKENGKISYDTENGAPKKQESGEGYVLDKQGDRIYYITDEDGKERIAYNRQNATKKLMVDNEGNAIKKQYNETELEVVSAEAKSVFEQAVKGDTVGFDLLVSKHSEDKGLAEYPDGYYVTEDTLYEAPEVIDAVFEMEVGDVRTVRSELGIHVVMRYDIEDGAYIDEKYEDTFIDIDTGTYVFIGDLMDELYASYLEPYKSRIEVDEELLATVDIKRAGINFYY